MGQNNDLFIYLVLLLNYELTDPTFPTSKQRKNGLQKAECLERTPALRGWPGHKLPGTTIVAFYTLKQ